MRCPQCRGYLSYEPEFLETPARLRCVSCGWMVSDPNFRNERPRYFPPDRVDKMTEWLQQYPGYDSYYPGSAAAQLGISESFFRYSVKADSAAPVILGRGRIACNTSALQRWWNSKNHHI
jgi:hypothetical protein